MAEPANGALPMVYQLRVVLRGISPLIWRRLLVVVAYQSSSSSSSSSWPSVGSRSSRSRPSSAGSRNE